MKKKLSAVLAAIIVIAAISVAVILWPVKTVEKALLIRNLSDYPINTVNIVTEEGRGSWDNRIHLIGFDDKPLTPGEERKIAINIPEKDLTKGWCFSASGHVGDTGVGHEDMVGKIWEDEVEGFSIRYDGENFQFTKL